MPVRFSFYPVHSKSLWFAEDKANNQGVQLLQIMDGGIGNESYDILQGGKPGESQELPLFPLNLTLKATHHFSNENKLGEGGFGRVYKVIMLMD